MYKHPGDPRLQICIRRFAYARKLISEDSKTNLSSMLYFYENLWGQQTLTYTVVECGAIWRGFLGDQVF